MCSSELGSSAVLDLLFFFFELWKNLGNVSFLEMQLRDGRLPFKAFFLSVFFFLVAKHRLTYRRK